MKAGAEQRRPNAAKKKKSPAFAPKTTTKVQAGSCIILAAACVKLTPACFNWASANLSAWSDQDGAKSSGFITLPLLQTQKKKDELSKEKPSKTQLVSKQAKHVQGPEADGNQSNG